MLIVWMCAGIRGVTLCASFNYLYLSSYPWSGINCNFYYSLYCTGPSACRTKRWHIHTLGSACICPNNIAKTNIELQSANNNQYICFFLLFPGEYFSPSGSSSGLYEVHVLLSGTIFSPSLFLFGIWLLCLHDARVMPVWCPFSDTGPSPHA